MATEAKKSVFDLGNEAMANAKPLKFNPVTVNGESVNNLPKSFKGYCRLPEGGLLEDGTYDFNKVVDSGEDASYSRLTVDIDGTFEKNGKTELLRSNAAALWGGAISALQKRAVIALNGKEVWAQFA